MLEAWVLDALDLMVNEQVPTLSQAAARLGRAESPQMCAAIERRRSFREQRDTMRRAYYASHGGVGDTDKTVIVGALLDDARRLRDQGKFKESAEVTAQTAKILGLGTAETNINLFSDVSGPDIQRAIELVKQRRLPASRPN